MGTRKQLTDFDYLYFITQLQNDFFDFLTFFYSFAYRALHCMCS